MKTKERIIIDDDLTVTARHFFTLPWDPRATNGSIWPEGGGILLKLSKNEYVVAGSGIVLEFSKTSEKQTIEKQKTIGRRRICFGKRPNKNETPQVQRKNVVALDTWMKSK